MSRTGLLGRLYGHEGLPAIDLAPADLARLGLQDGDLVRVASRRGAIVLPARASEGLLAGQAFLPMHWGQEVLSGQDDQGQPLTGVNALTTPAFCPSSKQPELKHAAVAIEKVDLPWRLSALAWLPAEQALAVREQLRPLLAAFGWASLLPFGREPDAQGRVGLVLRGAAATPVDGARLAPARALLGLDGPEVLRYQDAAARQDRALRVQRDADGRTQLQAFWLAGDTGGEAWLRQLLEADTPLPGPAHLLLAPGELARALVGEAAAPASPRSAPASMCGRTPSARPWRLRRQPRGAPGRADRHPALRQQLRLLHPRAARSGEGRAPRAPGGGCVRMGASPPQPPSRHEHRPVPA
jgi:assimilatory nitrate reductase catalytic subunit